MIKYHCLRVFEHQNSAKEAFKQRANYLSNCATDLQINHTRMQLAYENEVGEIIVEVFARITNQTQTFAYAGLMFFNLYFDPEGRFSGDVVNSLYARQRGKHPQKVIP